MKPFRVGAIALALLFAGNLSVPAKNSQFSETQAPIGLRNFGYVTDHVYRGAQPSSAGFNALKSMNVGIVVNFRNGAIQSASEKREVESLGMKYVSIPWSGLQNPSNS